MFSYREKSHNAPPGLARRRGAHHAAPHKPQRPRHDPDPAEITFVRIELTPRKERGEFVSIRETIAASIVHLALAQGVQRDALNLTDEVGGIIPKKTLLRKTNGNGDIRHDSFRIDAFLGHSGWYINGISHGAQ